MCEDHILGFRRILSSLVTRVPRYAQGADEMFPAVRVFIVSLLFMCAQKRII
jgi:hypothetical protein